MIFDSKFQHCQNCNALKITTRTAKSAHKAVPRGWDALGAVQEQSQNITRR